MELNALQHVSYFDFLCTSHEKHSNLPNIKSSKIKSSPNPNEEAVSYNYLLP